MTAGQQALAGIGGSVLPPALAAGSSTGQTGVGGNATGRVQFLADGSISYTGLTSEVGGGPAQWAKFIQAGIGNSIFMRATATSGTMTSNGAAAFTLINTTLTFTKGPSIPNAFCIVTFDFSYDGVNVALSSPGWTIQADPHLMKDHNVAMGVIGASSAAVASVSPQEWAAYAAIALNVLLIGRFLWRFIIKPIMLYHGWIKGRPKPFLESTDNVPL